MGAKHLPYEAAGGTMGIVKRNAITYEDIQVNGMVKVKKANVIGPPEGWPEHTLRAVRIGPGGYTTYHNHDWEHVNYIIKGKAQLTIGEATHELAEGDYAYVPPNVPHQFKNPCEHDLEFICIVPQRGA